jgi:hypothetical protein
VPTVNLWTPNRQRDPHPSSKLKAAGQEVVTQAREAYSRHHDAPAAEGGEEPVMQDEAREDDGDDAGSRHSSAVSIEEENPSDATYVDVSYDYASLKEVPDPDGFFRERDLLLECVPFHTLPHFPFFLNDFLRLINEAKQRALDRAQKLDEETYKVPEQSPPQEQPKANGRPGRSRRKKLSGPGLCGRFPLARIFGPDSRVRRIIRKLFRRSRTDVSK